jgi:hypothetical protein
MPEGGHTVPYYVFENWLLMADVKRTVDLFIERTYLPRHDSQPEMQHPTEDEKLSQLGRSQLGRSQLGRSQLGRSQLGPSSLGLSLGQLRLPAVWVMYLSEVFENITFLSGWVSLADDTKRPFTPGEICESALLYELTSFKEIVCLPEDAATALYRLKWAAKRYHKVAILKDPLVETSGSSQSFQAT